MRQSYSVGPSSSSNNNSGSNALLVAKPDGTYDWSSMIDGSQALMAEITEETAKSEASDTESGVTMSETVSAEENVTEAKSVKSEEKKPAEKTLDLATATAGMSTAGFISFMADLDSDAKKVHISLSSVVDACKKML